MGSKKVLLVIALLLVALIATTTVAAAQGPTGTGQIPQGGQGYGNYPVTTPGGYTINYGTPAQQAAGQRTWGGRTGYYGSSYNGYGYGYSYGGYGRGTGGGYYYPYSQLETPRGW